MTTAEEKRMFHLMAVKRRYSALTDEAQKELDGLEAQYWAAQRKPEQLS